ncbi:tetratricopeptide repeat protein [Prochlorococcus sp. MIT 1303]|uniref:tetratricopeptide repeat protein n=1 Tax=Prochlorococcus sp. MIT 1303 TaxID=1723647 RepID=UPI0007B3DC25|nr:tetratricopeptide repeat protein [Prochlorococcus sp. MIT 1303]KZR70342.1 Photosystem I assembly protein Ycf3 [Prochlorococcus sp. MIT 1303]
MTESRLIHQLLEEGNYQECIKFCQDIIRKNPNSTVARKYAGKCLLIIGDSEQAIEYLLKANELDNSDPEVTKDIGTIFARQGDKNTALLWYWRSLEINKNYAPALCNIGKLKQISGDHQEAIRLFRLSIASDPLLFQAYIGIANSSIAINNLDEAKAFAEKALETNKRAPRGNEVLGIICQKKGEESQALYHYKRELEINSRALLSLINQGTILFQQDKTEQAVESLLKATQIKPSEECSLLLAQAYEKLGKLQEAISEYQKLAVKNTKNKLIPYKIGVCFQKIGSHNDAINELMLATEIDSSFIEAWHSLSISLAYNGRKQEAHTAALKAINLSPNNINVHIQLAKTYIDLGNLDQALTCILKSLELNPDDPDLYMMMSIINIKLGNLDQAIDSTLKTLKLQPDNPEAYINLGGIYHDLDKTNDAVSCFLKSIELKTDNPIAYMNLGSAYNNLGAIDQAIAATLRSLELRSNNSIARMNLCRMYRQIGYFDQAINAIEKSLVLNPKDPDALSTLGDTLNSMGQLEESIEAYKKAFEINPTISNACKALLHFSDIYIEKDEIAAERKDYLENIVKIFRGKIKTLPDEKFPYLSLLMLTYQNLSDDKEIMQFISEHTCSYLNLSKRDRLSSSFRQEEQVHNKGGNGIGFFFDNTDSEHVIVRHYYNLVKACKNAGFKITLIKGPNAIGHDDIKLRSASSRVIQLSNNLKRSVELLKSQNLDLLVYTEMHSSSAPYSLAHNRIAPIQIVLPGNEITTGLDTIDYYFSNDINEPQYAQKNYSEKLIRLNCLATTLNLDNFCFRKIEAKAELGIPENKQLIGIMHNPIKFHPDMDEIFEGIAQLNPDINFVAVVFNAAQSERLKKRWRQKAPKAFSKCLFLNKMKKEKYFMTLSHMDVVLDPLYRGGGTSSFDALALGVPIISMPVNHARSRFVHALYKVMKLEKSPIARNREEYVKWCTDILSSDDLRQSISSSIRNNFHEITKLTSKSEEEMVEVFNNLLKSNIRT